MAEEKAVMESYNASEGRGKGGFRATMFIFAANTLTNFMGSTFLLSLIDGFISDTYLSRLHTCLIFGVLELISLAMVETQARLKSLQPAYYLKEVCVEGNSALMPYGSLCILALGSGGVRGALPALGADQFNGKDPKEAKPLAGYFNFLLLGTVMGAAVGVTVIVKISITHGWFWGFLLCLISASISFIILATGKPFYRLRSPGDSPILRIVQVIVVATKNSKLAHPENSDELYEIGDKQSDPIQKS